MNDDNDGDEEIVYLEEDVETCRHGQPLDVMCDLCKDEELEAASGA